MSDPEIIDQDDQHIAAIDFDNDPTAYDQYEHFADIKRMHLGELAVEREGTE